MFEIDDTDPPSRIQRDREEEMTISQQIKLSSEHYESIRLFKAALIAHTIPTNFSDGGLTAAINYLDGTIPQDGPAIYNEVME